MTAYRDTSAYTGLDNMDTDPKGDFAYRASLEAQVDALKDEIDQMRSGNHAIESLVTHRSDGSPRDPRDVTSDPGGMLIHDSNEPLYAAKPERVVKMPTNSDEAELMVKLGMMWLEHNAPEKLKAQEDQPAAEVVAFGCGVAVNFIGWIGNFPVGTKLYIRPEKLRKTAEEAIE